MTNDKENQMSAIPSQKNNPNGLHQRYEVKKLNGEPTDPMATYFVLRLDHFGRDGLHIRACREAAIAYAKYVLTQGPSHLSNVAADLHQLVVNLEQAG